MSGILVVERSGTLQHLLQRTLSAAQIGIDRLLMNYGETQALLSAHAGPNAPWRVLILGAPQRPSLEFDGLLEFLKSPPMRELAVLVLAHEKNAALSGWLAERRQAGVLLWSNFSRLPAALKQLLPETSTLLKPAATINTGLRLLFVDDSASVRFAYSQLLGDAGYQVDAVASVAEGYERATTQNYDLAILDYYLTDGTGDELVLKLKQHPFSRHLPIAIITGSYKDSIIKRCLDAGAVECMFKNEVLELTLARIRALARSIESQRHVEAERQRLDGILASVGDGVYGVDENGAVTFVNPTGLKLLGFVDDAEVLGKKAHALFHFAAGDGVPLPEDQSPMARAYSEGSRLASHETVFWRRSGEALPVECSVVPLAISNQRRGSVVVFRDISERKTADQLRWEMLHDDLTGIANRRHLIQKLTDEIARRRERGGYSAVVYIDLDRWSLIAETAGEHAARRVLVEVGGQLKQRLREDDLVARLEDDHYAMLLTGLQLENLFTIADGFREHVHAVGFQPGSRKLAISASLGVSILSRDTPSAEYVLEHARMACQQAKRRGGDQTQIFVPEADARIARELDSAWAARIREALAEDRFLLLVQPIVTLPAAGGAALDHRGGWRLNQGQQSERLFEFLVRMVGRDGQLISPGVFVPLAERVGMMPKVDLWVISRVLRYLTEQPTACPLSATINLSNLTLQDPEALKHIEALIEGSGIPGSRLIFEVTETAEIGSLHSARKFIQDLRRHGCRFALDDFGTGFSSMSHLKHLPVDFVKIEGSFISDLAESEIDQKVVGSMIAMAHSLKLKVIAEHVASEEIHDWVQRCGADYAQGHWLGEPRALSEVNLPALVG